jgi:hypothetical protein
LSARGASAAALSAHMRVRMGSRREAALSAQSAPLSSCCR